MTPSPTPSPTVLEPPTSPAVAHRERDAVEQAIDLTLDVVTRRLASTMPDTFGELAGRWQAAVDERLLPLLDRIYGPAPGRDDFLHVGRQTLLAADLPDLLYRAAHPDPGDAQELVAAGLVNPRALAAALATMLATRLVGFRTIRKIARARQTKIWVSMRDSRVRDTHVDLDDGTPIPVDQPFTTSNGDQLYYPGDTSAPPSEWINCRCVLIAGPRRPLLRAIWEGLG